MGRLGELATNQQTDYSDDWPAALQRRYIMPQRSPVTFWLLLAATLAVYAVAISWVASGPFPTPVHAWAIFDALTFGQLSLICIWSALRPVKTAWSRIAPIAAVPLAAVLVAAVVQDPVAFWTGFSVYLFYYGLCAGLLLAVLWFLRRTRFWQRRFGTPRVWQFSLAELLIVMTAVAVLATAMRDTPFLGGDGWLAIAFIVSSVAIALANVLIWSLSIHWLLRLSGATSIALILGVVLALATGFEPIVARIIGGDLLIQSVVLSIWLGAGVILPAACEATAGETPPPIP